jgi:hypothetical protein
MSEKKPPSKPPMAMDGYPMALKKALATPPPTGGSGVKPPPNKSSK